MKHYIFFLIFFIFLTSNFYTLGMDSQVKTDEKPKGGVATTVAELKKEASPEAERHENRRIDWEERVRLERESNKCICKVASVGVVCLACITIPIITVFALKLW